MNLKPCPFCWFPAELVNEYGKWLVKCSSESDCQGQVDISPSGLNGWESAELAIGGWNERAHEPRRTDASQGMSDGELLARVINHGLLLVSQTLTEINRPNEEQDDRNGDLLSAAMEQIVDELCRRASRRGEGT